MMNEGHNELNIDEVIAPPPAPIPLVPDEDFKGLPFSERIQKALDNLGWKQPTAVQQLCLPWTLAGRDVAGFAQTGTGKTGVFLLTMAHLLPEEPPPPPSAKMSAPEAVVLLPTRELAIQVAQDAEKILEQLGIPCAAVYGGVDFDKQANEVRKARVLMATPGRLKDFYQRKLITLDGCKIFVCDEADRMFDMGFIEDVTYFLDKLPENTQKLMFSATTNDQVKELAFEYLNKPEYISVNPEELTPENIEQHAIITDSKNKLLVMLGLLQDHKPTCAVIFVNTKLTAEWLHHKLCGNGIEAELITGDMPQRKRTNLIARIKEGKVKVLIATDVASRGLHISKLSHVYNFDIPDDPANYVHRIGRTARAGAEGSSYSLICEDYGENWIAILDMLGEKFELKSVWYDPKYLTIEDKATNPYLNGKRSESTDSDARRPRSNERHGAQRGNGRNFDDRKRGGDNRGGRDQKRDFDGPRGQQRGPQQARGGNQDRDRGGRQHNNQQRNQQNQNRPRHNTQIQKAPEKSLGLFGLIRKMFRAIFGLKS